MILIYEWRKATSLTDSHLFHCFSFHLWVIFKGVSKAWTSFQDSTWYPPAYSTSSCAVRQPFGLFVSWFLLNLHVSSSAISCSAQIRCYLDFSSPVHTVVHISMSCEPFLKSSFESVHIFLLLLPLLESMRLPLLSECLDDRGSLRTILQIPQPKWCSKNVKPILSLVNLQGLPLDSEWNPQSLL